MRKGTTGTAAALTDPGSSAGRVTRSQGNAAISPGGASDAGKVRWGWMRGARVGSGLLE